MQLKTSLQFLRGLKAHFSDLFSFFKEQETGNVRFKRKTVVTKYVKLLSLENNTSFCICSLIYHLFQHQSLPSCPTYLRVPAKKKKRKKRRSTLCSFLSQLLMIAGAPWFPLGPRNAHLKNRPDVHGGCQPQFLMQ